MSRIYIAHSKKDSLVDPDSLRYEPEDSYGDFMHNMVHVCYPAIDCCDAVMAVPDAKTGRLTPGVWMEIDYARAHGIEVLVSTEAFI